MATASDGAAGAMAGQVDAPRLESHTLGYQASLLVGDFYLELARVPWPSKAEALRQAQLAIKAAARYRHPAFRSPFLIIGNWR